MLKDEYFTISQLAEYVGVSRMTIYRWIRDGLIEVEVIGRERIVSKTSITSHVCPACKRWLK